MSIHCTAALTSCPHYFLAPHLTSGKGEEKSDWVAARMEARLLGTWLPTLINLGSVTVSDWFLLALSLYTAVASSAQELSSTSFPPPSLLVPQKLYTSGTSPLHPLILMIMPPIRIEARSVARSGRSNLLGDNAGRKTRGHFES